jgi:uncharacterized protein YkwD
MIKLEINNSKLGGVLIRSTSFAERRLYDVFGGLSTESLTHLVISPESMESVALSVDNLHLMPDEKAEMELYDLVNRERGIAGLAEFEWNENLVNIARRHASDMWTRKYFSHYSPEGNNAGDRLEAGGVNYYLAGENLALADSVDTAHQGLMNSEGHRANILSPNFKKIGIGVVDNIQYGKLFVQIFTD